MLLKRLEVTLNSFLGDDKNEKLNQKAESRDQVRQAIENQRKYLEHDPTRYTIEDALQAPISLVLEQAQKVIGEVKTGDRSLVKKVIIGYVPDRGGRVNEIRHKRIEEDRGHNRFGGGGGFRNKGGDRGNGKGGFQKGGNNHGDKNEKADNNGNNKDRSNNNSDNQSNKNNNNNSNNNQSSGRVVVVTGSDNSNNNSNNNNNNQRKGNNNHHNNSHHQNKKGRREG